MRKFLKYFWVLPILVVTLIFGTLFLPNTEKDSMQEFQKFTNSYIQLIREQGEIENFEDIRLELSKDLTYKNGSYMISGDKFAKITGSKLNYLDNGQLEISNFENTITLYDNSNTLRINSVDIDVMQNSSDISLTNSQFPIEDVATELGYEIVYGSDTLTLTRPYITKRLMVYSDANLDDFGAIQHIEGYDNLHIYQYDNETQTKDAYEYFSSLNNVTSVEVDAIITPASNNNEEDPLVTPLGLDDTFSFTSWGANAMGVNTYSEYLKANVGVDNFPEIVVAVLDTGIDSDHVWFNNRLATLNNEDVGANFSSSENSTCVYEDVFGHGTHVSGIIADLTFSNVKILPIKVMNDNGYGFSSAIKLGVDYVIQLKNQGLNIVAMNMSLGTTSSVGSTNHSDFKTKINTAYNLGILSVVAAGNKGEDCSTNTPANVNSAITVSAVSHTGNVYFRPEWSNYGTYIDVCAPGGDIRSAAVGGGTRLDSGTSMAAPHIAGIIALFHTDYSKNHTPASIEQLLDNSSIDLGDTGWDTYYGEGLVNIQYANATLIDEVVFSNTTTDHTNAFELTLSTTTPNAKIYYTINNDSPCLSNAIEYTQPLYISRTQKISAVAYIIENDNIVAYSKIRTIMYCFYGEDIEDAYTVSSNGTLLSYTGGMLDVTIPMTINGITIRAIGESAFANSYIESVTLPSTVTLIGRQAFNNCVNLKYVYAPNVTKVGIQSFFGCTSLEYLTDEYFPELQTIDKYAFVNCYYLHTVSLSKVKLVDYFSFYMEDQANKYITTITLPSATTVGEYAFYNCTAITTLNIPNVHTISSSAFANCNVTGELYLPNLEYLGSKAFYNNKNISNVNMPKVKIIGSQCFYMFCTNITTVNIPNAQIVGSKAFSGCSNIVELIVSELHEASSEAFSGMTQLTEISLPKLQYAGKNAFYSMSGVSSLELPNIIKLSAHSFGNNANLQKVYLPSSIEYIDNLAFKNCSNICVFSIYYNTIAHDFVKANGYFSKDLAKTNNAFLYNIVDNEIHITGYEGYFPDNLIIPSYINSLPVTKICANAFINCTTLYNLNVSKLKTIEEYAFVGCTNLTSVTLNAIENIERDAFKNCTALTEVNITNIKTLGNNAFYNCESLLSIKLSENITSIGDKALGYINGDKIIPTFYILGYKNSVAETYADNLDIPFHAIFDNVTSFYYDYYDNNGREDITITLVDSYTTGSLILPSSYGQYTISKISQQAFMNCSFITGIQLPSTITTIESEAFYDCSLLEEINLDNVTSLGVNTFSGCSSLKEINLEHLTEIPEYCFNGCERIAVLNIPNVTKINRNAFSNCFDLHTVISPKLEHIERDAFSSCSSLEKIDTYNIKYLGTFVSNTEYYGQVFVYCEKLTSAYFPNLVRVAPSIFSSTTNKVVVGDKLVDIYGTPFANPIKIYGYAGSKIIAHAVSKSISYVAIDRLALVTDVTTSSQCERFEELTLSIEVEGFEQTYQWYSTTSNTSTNGVAIDGATESTFKVNTNNIGTAKYYVVATDWEGNTVTSSLSTVNVFDTDSTYIVDIETPTSNGTITNLGTNYVTAGENFAIKFTPNAGCYISSLVIDGVELSEQEIQAIVDNNYIYEFNNVDSDHTVAVSYATAYFTVTVIQSEKGVISEAKDNYAYGASGYFHFTPNNGYYVEYITLDGEAIPQSKGLEDYLLSNITADHTISAKFSPRDDMQYTVNHYQQSVNNSGTLYYDNKFYNLESTETLTGTTDTMTEAIAKTYIGFYVLHFENVLIDPNLSKITINIYYDRETYTVSLFKGTGIEYVSGSGDYLYGETVTIFAEVSYGYTFEKWTSEAPIFYEDSINVCYTFTINNHNADFTASAVISDSGPSEPSEPTTPTPPSDDDNNNNNTPTTPETNDTTASNGGGLGGGAVLGIIIGVIGVIIVLIVVVIIKKSKNSRF